MHILSRITLAVLIAAGSGAALAEPDMASILAAEPAGAAAGACTAHIARHHGAPSFAERRAAMEAELQDYLRLAEEALAMRAAAIRFHRELQAKADAGAPLSGHDLKRLDEGAAALLAQRRVLMDVAEAHECWVYAPMADDPREAGLRATGVAMSLSAALILYDNYLSAVVPFRRHAAWRQHLNRSDRGFARELRALDDVSVSFASLDNRRRTRLVAEWLERHAAALSPEPFEQYGYLLRSIEQSPSLHLVRRVSPLRDMAGYLDFLGSLTVDAVLALKDEGTNLSSLLFGNTVGLVETRRGKLHGQPAVTRQVQQTLRAGDILLEKTPFRLTDTFIPGHWGHAAVWVGGEAELRELGVWDHPVVRPHQAAIRAGRGVVEALRSGVEMNSVAHFLNVDDLAVLRPMAGESARQAEVVVQALRQVGKEYDFNFDAETTHRVFCSKLVYLAYGDLQWPTSRVLGRATVSPDDIAVRATGDGPLTVALLYHDGRQVAEEPRRAAERLVQSARLALAQREKSRQAPDRDRRPTTL